MTLKPIRQITWAGPYSWPGFEDENKLLSVPKITGVYLQTFEYKQGYLIYAAGITRQSVPERFRQHKRKYMNGEYNVLDISAVQQGLRKEIWHGWGYRNTHQKEFEEHKSIILEAVRRQLINFRIFVATMSEPRVLERLEASIMNTLYQQLPPICDIPDTGMQLAPRWKMEEPIITKNYCTAMLYGLPSLLEI